MIGLNPNIPIAKLSEVALPSTEEGYLFYDSENDLHLTGIKNVSGARVVTDYLFGLINFSRTFSPSEFKSTGTPIDLLPASGVGSFYGTVSGLAGMLIDFNSIPFNNAGGMFITSDNTDPFIVFDTDAVNTTTGGIFVGVPYTNSKANYENKKLTLLSPAGDFTDGDSDVTIKFTVSIIKF